MIAAVIGSRQVRGRLKVVGGGKVKKNEDRNNIGDKSDGDKVRKERVMEKMRQREGEA